MAPMSVISVASPRIAALRTALTLAAATAAAAHVPVIAPHLDEAPYMGVLFVLFTGFCALVALAAPRLDDPRLYAAAATVCGAGIVTYAATRLVAFPQLADDVGNWTEPLGLVSIAAEAVVVATAGALFRRAMAGRASPR